jgi:phenylalanyl-tRNA synthetase beta chain
MKISFNWLSEYIDLKDYRSNIDGLSQILTAAGLEVEGVTDQSAAYKHVVIAKLLEVSKHPDADKLTVCKVDVGDSAANQPSPRQIVCGAKNHKAGDYVVAALPGAVLPGNFEIKKSKIRGQESLGMLCSNKEVGLSEESDGVIVLKEGQPGQSFSEAFSLNDVIIEINVTPNRADCLSHLGLAQELSALLDRPVKKPVSQLKTGAFKTTDLVKVNLQAPDRCPRYAGRSLKGVTVGASPAWLVQRLESVGLRSINNVVDVTNFVMFEYGQPLHAFDSSQIKGAEITIRPSQKNEKFTSLDGTELTLTGEELVIADKERAVALAGVVGGQNSGVNAGTKDLFIESAFFSSQGVRRTSRRFGFETDSSYRYSRGINPEQTVEALERACDLMVQVAGGEVASDFYDIYPKALTKEPITADVKYIAQRIGYAVAQADFDKVMKRLGCKVEGNKVTPPLHRWDISIPDDLVEEYARVNGYDQLNETLPTLVEEPTKHTLEYIQIRQVSEFLVGQGFEQAVNYAFLNKDLQERVLGSDEDRTALGLKGMDPIVVKNPVSEDFAILRMSLLPSLVQNLSHNTRHGNLAGQIFEIGRGHYAQAGKYLEDQRLGFALWGSEASLWAQKIPAVYRLKSHMENLLKAFAPAAKWQWRNIEAPMAFLHPSQSVQLVFQGQTIGFLGSVHPQKAKEMKLREDAAFGEINFQALFKSTKPAKFKNIPAYPAVEKDLAFVVPKSLKAADVCKEITKAAGHLLQTVEVVDIYEDAAMGSDKRSLTFRMVFQSGERTLSDEEVMKLFTTVIDAVSQKLSVQLR